MHACLRQALMAQQHDSNELSSHSIRQLLHAAQRSTVPKKRALSSYSPPAGSIRHNRDHLVCIVVYYQAGEVLARRQRLLINGPGEGVAIGTCQHATILVHLEAGAGNSNRERCRG